jgi:hypothetical protein
MDNAKRKARVSELCALIEKVISQYADVLGPQSCIVHGEDMDPDECDDDCTFGVLDAMNRTWVLCTAWEITEEGEAHGSGMPDYLTPEGSMSWESIGLLTHVLDDIRGVA